ERRAVLRGHSQGIRRTQAERQAGLDETGDSPQGAGAGNRYTEYSGSDLEVRDSPARQSGAGDGNRVRRCSERVHKGTIYADLRCGRQGQNRGLARSDRACHPEDRFGRQEALAPEPCSGILIPDSMGFFGLRKTAGCASRFEARELKERLGIGETQVFNRFAKALLGVTVLTVMGIGAVLAQTPAKQVKDQGEYDLFTEVGKTTDAQKRLTLLNTWTQKYPDTAFKEERWKYYAVSYQQLGQGAKMAEAAKEILAINPKEVNALFWLTALTLTLPPTPDS